MNYQQVAQTTVSGVIALILTVAVVAIVLFQVQAGRNPSVPPELQDPFLMVVAFFYGQHASQNGARQAGTAAAQTAVTALKGNGNDVTKAA